jgi:hypothetical protein
MKKTGDEKSRDTVPLSHAGTDRRRHECLTSQLPCLRSTHITQVIISSKDEHCRSFQYSKIMGAALAPISSSALQI